MAYTAEWVLFSVFFNSEEGWRVPPIAPHHRQFLRFAYQGRAYQFKVMPFSRSLAPRIFTRCVAAALAPIQARGLTVLPYLDDWLLVSPTAEQAVRDTAVLLGHVDLTVNYSKSSLTPSQKVDYLGMTLDSQVMRAFLSQKRVKNILQLIGCFQKGRVLRYGLFLKLLGMLTAASMVIPLGLLSLWPLQIWGESQVAQGQERQDIQPLLSSPEALEEKGVSGQGGSPRSDPCPPRGCGDRCLSVRLGCSLAAQDHQGQMECTAWRLPRRTDLLSQLEGCVWHPNPDRLQLWVWPLGTRTHSWHPVTSQ